MRAFDARVRRVGALVMILTATGIFTSFVGDASAFTGGSVSPTTLSTSGDRFTISYTGKTSDPLTPNMIVEECIADDTKIGFDIQIDCSPLSLVNYSNVATPNGSVVYGGDPNNRLAPFVGIDENNGLWSVCDPASGVTNYQSGFFRLADSPSDEADDSFVPFTCAGSPPPSTTTTTAPTATTTTTTPGPATTTTTTPGGTTTTTLGRETTTTTLGDGSTTTTMPDGTTTTTTPDPGNGGSSGDSSGGGSGSDGTSGDALARTGTNAVELVKLALLLVYVGVFMRPWGRSRRGKDLA